MLNLFWRFVTFFFELWLYIINLLGMKLHVHSTEELMMNFNNAGSLNFSENLLVTACHEAGHVLVTLNTPNSFSLKSATIQPTTNTLGMTRYLFPNPNKTGFNFKQLLAQMDVYMGGNVAVELTFPNKSIDSSNSSDLQEAKRIARLIATNPKVIGDSIQLKEFSKEPHKSNIESNMLILLENSRNRVISICCEKKEDLKKISDGLCRYRTLSRADIVYLLKR